ncbi:hypothetical protein M422DRAFT_273878 [Sphaerobolus stellatus SS14]|uniref:Uncharacterized protein n=1 Tax=Sphaerobolus stellatus (strain SS14) TaxID=990650 RepID=A0A0C9UIT4_SPHS4|nr:hypothetical protein M422DRAFT_273878 [Sphaerobolus stellatus SS14]
MNHKHGITRRARADELSAQAVDISEPTSGLTARNLANSPSLSVDPQQRLEMLTLEHPSEPHATAYGMQTVPNREQSPLRLAGPSCMAAQGLSPSRLAGTSATQGSYSPRGIGLDSGSCQDLGDVMSDPEHVSPEAGDTEEDEDFIIPTSEVSTLRQEYTEFINLKENTEIVESEAIEATERVNTVFTRIRASMNRISPRMKELLLVPSQKATGKMCKLRNNLAHDKAAAKAATEHIIDQTAMMISAPFGSRSRYPQKNPQLLAV